MAIYFHRNLLSSKYTESSIENGKPVLNKVGNHRTSIIQTAILSSYVRAKVFEFSELLYMHGSIYLD